MTAARAAALKQTRAVRIINTRRLRPAVPSDRGFGA